MAYTTITMVTMPVVNISGPLLFRKNFMAAVDARRT
jgi:hypothetical protein